MRSTLEIAWSLLVGIQFPNRPVCSLLLSSTSQSFVPAVACCLEAYSSVLTHLLFPCRLLCDLVQWLPALVP